MKQKRHQQRGAALLMVLVLMLIFGIFTTAYWAHLHTTLRYARADVKAQRAKELAHAGIARALAEVSAGTSPLVALPPVPLGDGYYTFTIAPHGADQRLIEVHSALGTPQEPRYPQTLRLTINAAGQALAFLPQEY